MDSLKNDFRSWMLSQHIDDCTIAAGDDDRISLESAVAHGTVGFYDLDDEVVVEMRVEKMADNSPAFFLHFALNDLGRAKELFGEMASVMDQMLHQTVRHVLLCCTCGMTTTFFAEQLNEQAQEMGIGYDFCAKSVDEAKRCGSEYAAVLLAPQVGYERKAIIAAVPDTLVMEIPARVFGTYDAAAALRLLLDAFDEARSAAASDLRVARDFDHSKRILSICYAYRSDEPTLSYRVLDQGKVSVGGMLILPTLDLLMLDDLAATLQVAGYPVDTFDAVGVAFPGVVDEGVVPMRIQGHTTKFDLAGLLRKRWGIPAYVDNGATAAAAGCYVSQTEWDSVAFHAQPVGVVACDQGYVVDGHPMVGRAGFSGNLKYLAKDYALSMDLDDAAWRFDGTRELVARYLCTTVCTMAPQAIYVWCDLMPIEEEIREEMAKTLPEEAIPPLVSVADYDGLMLVGEFALCLQRLAEEEQ
ncbi:MAG: hypothetical protein Q4A01_06860 [Coriobacteriales bacterium]|nr:hypothetical protein [Coriobacteriales bacterium]